METEGSTVVSVPEKRRMEKAEEIEGKGWFHSGNGRTMVKTRDKVTTAVC